MGNTTPDIILDNAGEELRETHCTSSTKKLGQFQPPALREQLKIEIKPLNQFRRLQHISRFIAKLVSQMALPDIVLFLCERGVKRNPIYFQYIEGGAVPSFRSN